MIVTLAVIDALSCYQLDLEQRMHNCPECALLGEDDDSCDCCELDADSADEDLNPVEKLEKFIDCEHSYSRYNYSHRLNSCLLTEILQISKRR